MHGFDQGAMAQMHPVEIADGCHGAAKCRRKTGAGTQKTHAGGIPPVRGVVTSNHWLGDQSHLGIEVGRNLLIAVAHGVVDAPIGSEIKVMLPTESLHLFDGETERALFHGIGAAALGA